LTPGTAEWTVHEPVTEIDPKDAATPDAWVPRHPDLIRLTGRSVLPGAGIYRCTQIERHALEYLRDQINIFAVTLGHAL
jgi:hypothetical protein